MTKDICAQVASFLAAKLELELGADIFYYQLPEEVDTCIAVQRSTLGVHVPVQIDAAVHGIRVVARSTSSDTAYALAKRAYDALDNTADASVDDAPGFIQLEETRAAVCVYDPPGYDSQDQQSRKTFAFYARLTTKR